MFRRNALIAITLFVASTAFAEDIPTRYGSLNVNDENMLLYKNRPLKPEIQGNNSLSTTVTCTAAPLQHLEIAPPAVYTAVPPLRVYQQIQPLRTYTAMAPIVSYTAVPLPTVRYAWHGSTLTLLNQSSAPALVRIIGPEGENVEVPARDSRKVNVVDGQYFVKIRFGTSEQNYTYSKGDSFSVTDTFTQSSELTLTFNSITGNYDTVGIPKEDFWK